MNTLGLVIETVWDDTDMLEFLVTASNGSFAGAAQFYVGLDEAKQIAQCISGFPRSSADVREYQLGYPEGSGIGGALLLLTCDGSGHVTVEVQMWAERQVGVPQRVSLFLKALPADIDLFVEQLLEMKIETGARASLRFAA